MTLFRGFDWRKFPEDKLKKFEYEINKEIELTCFFPIFHCALRTAVVLGLGAVIPKWRTTWLLGRELSFVTAVICYYFKMSPTKTTYKEDLLVVADLDTANTTKESEISVNLVLPKSLPTFRLADKSAIEHEESTIKLPISEGLSEKEDAECCQKQLEDNTGQFK